MLPPSVQLAVRSRRRQLARRARGRVLDLGGAESHDSLWNGRGITDVVRAGSSSFEADVRALAEAGEEFDTVLSVFRLVAAADLDGTLAHLRRLLSGDGQLLFLEPARRSGSVGRAQRLVAPGIILATGWRIDRDIPARLRRARLSITALERHRTSTVQWWLRGLLEGTAHRALEPAARDLQHRRDRNPQDPEEAPRNGE